MAKGIIDPAFVTAPFFGQSSYDPIAEVRRIREGQAALGASEGQRARKDQEAGLKDLDLDIKTWNDEKGYEEISEDIEKLKSQYVELGTKGLNLYNPTTKTEQKISRAIRTRLADIKHKNDVWQQQKKLADDVQAVIVDQKQKPEDEQDIDIEATAQKIAEWKNNEGGILDRPTKVEDVLIGKSRPVDVGKYMLATLPKLVPGLDKTINRVLLDETTGKWQKTTWEGVSPSRAREGMKKAIAAAPINVKNAIKKMYDADPEKGVMNLEEWALEQWGPAYPSKTSKEQGISGAGAGGGKGVLPEKDDGGNYPVQPQIRDMHFATASGSQDQVYPYESVGRVPIGDLFGYKNITVMGSANNQNTRTGRVEGKGEAVPAMPAEINLFPVAKKDTEITVIDPYTKKEVTERVTAGERIPGHILEKMRIENAQARENGEAPKYLINYSPFVTMGLSYKQRKDGKSGGGELDQMVNIYLGDQARPTSYTETSIVPYDEIKQDLFAGAKENKSDWAPYDKYIREMMVQLNADQKMNNIFEDKSKSVDDLFNALEGND